MDDNNNNAINIININNNIHIIINDLKQIINFANDNSIVKGIEQAITKLNNIIDTNNKNDDSIKDEILKMENQVNKTNRINKTLNISIFIVIICALIHFCFFSKGIRKYKELKFEKGIYLGQVLNGLRDGKGSFLFHNGDKFEGKWKMIMQREKGFIILIMVIDMKENLKQQEG